MGFIRDQIMDEFHDAEAERQKSLFMNKSPLTDTKWPDRFMEIARQISFWSKDPSTKIGAVAVRDRRIIAQGYNGFPAGISDADTRLYDRDTKYKYIIHAEKNMIYNAAKEGISLTGCDVYIYGLPTCSECAKALIQTGVSHVYVIDEFTRQERWAESWKSALEMYWEAGVKYDTLLFTNS